MITQKLGLTAQLLRRVAAYLVSDDAVLALSVTRSLTNSMGPALVGPRPAGITAVANIAANAAALQIDPAYVTIVNAVSGAVPGIGGSTAHALSGQLNDRVDQILERTDSFAQSANMLSLLRQMSDSSHVLDDGTDQAARAAALEAAAAQTDSVALQIQLSRVAEWFVALTTVTKRLAALESSDLSAVSVRTLMDCFGWGSSACNLLTFFYDAYSIGVSEMDASGRASVVVLNDIPANDDLDSLDRMIILMERVGIAENYQLEAIMDAWTSDVAANNHNSCLGHLHSALWKLGILTDVEAVTRFEASVLAIAPNLSLERPVQSALMTLHRAENFFSWQVFTSLQAAIAIFQITFTAIECDELAQYIDSADVAILQSLNHREVIADFMALPVGSMTATLLDGFGIVKEARVGDAIEPMVAILSPLNVSYTCATSEEAARTSTLSSEATSATISTTLRQYVRMIRVMRSIVMNKPLMELYKQGATIASSAKLRIASLSRDVSNYPVNEISFGTFNDSVPSSLEDAEFGFNLPYPLNASNSSLLLAIARNGFRRGAISGEVLPYSYACLPIGVVSLNERNQLINDLILAAVASNNAVFNIADLWRYAVPLQAIPKRVPSSMSAQYVPNREYLALATPEHVPFPTMMKFSRVQMASEAQQTLVNTSRTLRIVSRAPLFQSPIPLEQQPVELAIDGVPRAVKPATYDTNLHRWLNVDSATLASRLPTHPLLRRLVTFIDGAPRFHTDQFGFHDWMKFMGTHFFVVPTEFHSESLVVIPKNAVLVLGEQRANVRIGTRSDLLSGTEVINSDLAKVVKHGFTVDPTALRSKTTVLTGLVTVSGNIWPLSGSFLAGGDVSCASSKAVSLENMLTKE